MARSDAILFPSIRIGRTMHRLAIAITLAALVPPFRIAGAQARTTVDSADTSSREPFQASERRAYRGQAIAIIERAKPGRITVTASAPGRAAGRVEIQ